MAASSSSCFGDVSSDEPASPVVFPPGCAKLATKPLPTGSVAYAMTMGIVLVACCSGRMAADNPVTMMSTFKRTSSAATSGNRSISSLGRAPLDDEILAFHIAELTHPLLEPGKYAGKSFARHYDRNPNAPHLSRLLRARRE